MNSFNNYHVKNNGLSRLETTGESSSLSIHLKWKTLTQTISCKNLGANHRRRPWPNTLIYGFFWRT